MTLLALMPPVLSGVALAGPALPTGGVYVAGAGVIAGAGSSLTVDQTSQRGIIDWKSFSIGKGGAVSFDNAGGATLNREIGGNLSSILGTLKASGTIYLINPQGVVIGASGVVVTKGSFVASTLDVANSAFVSGGALLFKGTTDAAVLNLGKISSSGGDVFLIARSVENLGSITAANGTVGLAAGRQALIKDSSADERVFVQVGGGDATNAGSIAAASAELKAAGGNVYALAGSNGGIVRATGTAARDGHVWLTAAGGTVSVAGTVAASNADGTGGAVIAKGETLTIASNAVIDAAGTKGKGTIETSGHDVSIGAARITAGKGGNWLVDPDDLTIDSTLAGTIDATLDAGTNVTEQTSASGTGGNGDIFVNSGISWNTTASLTLTAYRNIAVGPGVTIANSAAGSLTLRADNTGTGTGTVSFGSGGAVNFSAGGAVSIFYNPLDGASQTSIDPTRYTTTIGYSGGSAGYTTQVMLGGGATRSAYMLVNTVYDLQNVQNALGGTFALGTDIDASATAGWNGGAGFTPIGSPIGSPYAPPFTGTFAGEGHIITGLTINRPSKIGVGLFDYSTGAISRVGLTAVNITGSADVGGLVGLNNGTITGSYSSGAVSGRVVGGLVGTNGGTITESYSTGAISGEFYIGGLVGQNSGLITGSYGACSVFGFSVVGGLASENLSSGTITGSYSTGAVTGQGSYTGGLVGVSFGTIIGSYNTGTVSGVHFVGGLVGANTVPPGYVGTITRSFSSGAVSGSYVVGGLVGQNYGDVDSSNSTGTVMGSQVTGGLAGTNFGTITNSYSTGMASGSRYVGGLVGQNLNLITEAYSSGVVSGTSLVGGLVGGNLTSLPSYITGSPTFVGTITHSYSTGAVSGSSITGGLAGQNYGAIANAYSTGAVTGFRGSGGLTGTNFGSITDAYSTAAVKGSTYVAGLVAQNFSLITGSYSTGTVSGTSLVGGLVGGNIMGSPSFVGTIVGSITQSYSDDAVSGANEIGGLVGHNTGTITQSYSTGVVSGLAYARGLVGHNDGSVASSYWDIQASGQATSAGGAGLTTAEFQSGLPSGFDPSVWVSKPGLYPYLLWRYPDGP